jgi:hypothetical protein
VLSRTIFKIISDNMLTSMNYLLTYLPTFISKQLTPFVRVLEGATASHLFVTLLAFNRYMFSAITVSLYK